MTDYRRHLKPGTVILCSQGGVAFNHAALDQLAEALVQAEREREIAESTASNLRTRLKTYSDLVMLRPFKWLAVRGADEAVPIPEPESFAAVVEERDTARAEVERLKGAHNELLDSRNHWQWKAAQNAEEVERLKRAQRTLVETAEAEYALVEADLARVRGALKKALKLFSIKPNKKLTITAQATPAEQAKIYEVLRTALEGRG